MQSNPLRGEDEWGKLHQVSSRSMPYLHAPGLSLLLHEQRQWKTTRKLSETEEELDLWLRGSGSLKVRKTVKNPDRPYFICRDRDCRFFQWAGVELTKRNKKKQGK